MIKYLFMKNRGRDSGSYDPSNQEPQIERVDTRPSFTQEQKDKSFSLVQQEIDKLWPMFETIAKSKPDSAKVKERLFGETTMRHHETGAIKDTIYFSDDIAIGLQYELTPGENPTVRLAYVNSSNVKNEEDVKDITYFPHEEFLPTPSDIVKRSEAKQKVAGPLLDIYKNHPELIESYEIGTFDI